MVFFSWFSISKRETRDSFPQSPGQWEELFYKKYLYYVFLPCWRGSCSFHSDIDTATLKGGWVACLSKFKCLDSKRKKKKRDVKETSYLKTGFKNPFSLSLTLRGENGQIWILQFTFLISFYELLFGYLYFAESDVGSIWEVIFKCNIQPRLFL